MVHGTHVYTDLCFLYHVGYSMHSTLKEEQVMNLGYELKTTKNVDQQIRDFKTNEEPTNPLLDPH